MKKTLRCVIFLAILLFSLAFVSSRLSFDDELGTKEVFNQFYGQPVDTIDGIYFGTSATQRGWIAPAAYKDYGLTVYSLATTSQPVAFTEFLMKESLKTQSPKLYIVDLRGIVMTPDDMTDAFIRRVTDNLKPSVNRLQAVRYILNYTDKGDSSVDTKDISYYIRLAKYHSLWDKASRAEKLGIEYLEGFAYFEPAYYKIKKLEDCGLSDEVLEIDPVNETMLNELMDYCDSLDANVLFVVSPCEASSDELKQYNYAQKLAEERGYTVLNFFDADLREAIDLDFSKYFYNSSHMNYYGADKYTRFLAEYIRDNYDLPDRRPDNISEWEKASSDLVDLTGDRFEKMLKKIEKMK